MITDSIKKFFSSKFNVYLIIFLLILGGLAFFAANDEPVSNADNASLSVHFFYLPTCPHCTEQKPIYFELKDERKDVNFFEHDASSQKGSQLFYEMAREAGLDTSKLGVPTIFVGSHPLVGFQEKDAIISAIDDCINNCKGPEYKKDEVQEASTGFADYELPFLGRTDLTKLSLPVLAVVLGLIDGFNPCAMWVLVYLISLLIGVNDKKRIWIIVGSFVLASGIMYFLFMTAWLNVFLLLGYMRILTLIIGLVALGGGILGLKEYFTSKGPLSCKVGSADSHEKTMSRIDKIIAQPLSWMIVLSIVGLAFIVNSVEFACSAAIPAVFTQIITLSGVSLIQKYLYILAYVFFFMLDDLIIFGMAAFAIGSSIGEKYAKYCRLFGGIIMSVLGVVLLFAPQLLR